VEVDPVVELYGLPPEQFTAVRNELAKALSDAGDTRDGAAVKALRKPTIAAWLANRLVRIAPELISELTEFGEALREAHQAGDRASLKKLSLRRHALVDRLVDTAQADAAGSGRTITASTAERLEATLDAAVVDPIAAKLLRSGRLTSGLRHVGFGVVDETGLPIPVAAAVPKQRPAHVSSVKARPSKPASTRKPASATTRKTPRDELPRRQRAELRERLRQVEGEYEAAEKERLEAESELDANEHHIADMQTAIERLTDELARARRELRQAQSRTRKLERALTRAARSSAAARRQRDAQQQRLEAFNE
jgi:hypothetical protein